MKLLKNKNIVGAIAIILVAVGIYYLFFTSKTSVLKDLEPEFTGYDKAGVMEYDMASINDKILDAIMKEELPKDDYEDMKDDLELAREEMYSSSSYKLKKVKSMFEKVKIEVDKVNDLANGDKVTFKVKAPKKSPIKSETKTFTVKGLEPSQEITIKDLLAEDPIEFVGYNGFGEAKFSDSSKLSSDYYNHSGTLSNGDKFKVKVENRVIENLKEEGKIIDEKNSIDEITVTGLKDISVIKNLDEVYKDMDEKIDEYLSDKLQGATLTVEPLNKYISIDANDLSVSMIYKITSTDSNKKEEIWYQLFGYDSIDVKDDTINLKNLPALEQFYKFTSLKEAQQNRTDNFLVKEYKE